MNQKDFISLLPGLNREDLDKVSMPGLVPAHGETRSLAGLFPDLAKLLEDYQKRGCLYSGKVRDRVDLGDKILLYTSDRVSAFDVLLGLVPCKGEVLNGISRFWFEKTQDIIPSHFIAAVGERGLLCKKARVLPVEVVVRGYLTGSAWRDYQASSLVSGIRLERGMNRDQKFEFPLITPSTKEDLGKHDEPISSVEILKRGLVKEEIWHQVETAALALFARGQAWAQSRGLILVDTKYEFGLVQEGEEERLILVDEVHTPDSSRYWYADTYAELFEEGKDQRKLDKEYLRSWLIENGWMGKGEAPKIPGEVFAELSWRYIQAYQELCGQNFEAKSLNLESDAQSLRYFLSGDAAHEGSN